MLNTICNRVPYNSLLLADSLVAFLGHGLFQILIIPHQHLLDLTHVHGVIVTLRITLVDGFLIDDATGLDFRCIHLLADEHQLCSSPAVISIHSPPMRLKGLNFKSL